MDLKDARDVKGLVEHDSLLFSEGLSFQRVSKQDRVSFLYLVVTLLDDN